MVGGFETLTAMENVESDPKTDRPKVSGKCQELCGDSERLWPCMVWSLCCCCFPKGERGADLTRVNVLLFCSQEEIRIQATTVFVDPYEEADAQVRVVFSHLIGQSSSSENFVAQ